MGITSRCTTDGVVTHPAPNWLVGDPDASCFGPNEVKRSNGWVSWWLVRYPMDGCCLSHLLILVGVSVLTSLLAVHNRHFYCPGRLHSRPSWFIDWSEAPEVLMNLMKPHLVWLIPKTKHLWFTINTSMGWVPIPINLIWVLPIPLNFCADSCFGLFTRLKCYRWSWPIIHISRHKTRLWSRERRCWRRPNLCQLRLFGGWPGIQPLGIKMAVG